MAGKTTVAVKRVYEKPSASDGTRILVDRLWPRGLKKSDAKIDAWLRDLAPSNELRKWFHAHLDERVEFRKRYTAELQGPETSEALRKLYALLKGRNVITLLFAAKNTDFNNATVLRDIVRPNSR